MKPIKIDGKRVAYVDIPEDDGKHWSVAICVEGEAGYRPVSDYGPYDSEERCRDVVRRLNGRLNVDTKLAHMIVLSTFLGKSEARRRTAKVTR